MIRLGIDATSVAPGAKGIARVQRGTVRALQRLGRHELVVFARHPRELPEVDAVAARSRLGIEWEQVGLPRAYEQHGLDALLTWSERLPIRGRGRYLVWLFEVPLHRVRENRRTRAGAYQRASDLLTLALWKRSLAKAALVLTPSASTARDFAVELPHLQERLRPVRPGVDEIFSPWEAARDDGYVFHLASADPRDNSQTALRSIAVAQRRLGRTVRFVVAGDLGERRDLLEQEARRLELTGVDFRGRVADDELVELYRGAAVYLDTSLYEGFGLQVLEAAACGAAVVASAATSVPEVLGEAGILRDPRDAEQLGEAVAHLLDDAGSREDLRRRGLERAREFTWERTARELADAIDEALA